MDNLNKTLTEQKLVIVKSDGHSMSLVGELEENRSGITKDDFVPSYLNMGWKVVQMMPFNNTSSVLVLLQKEVRI